MGRKGKSRPDGQYEVKVTVDHDFEGKPIRKSFYSPKSKADARRKAEEYKIEIAIKKQTGKLSANDSFEKVFEQLYAIKAKTVRASTHELQHMAVKKHFCSAFKDRKMNTIKQFEIKNIFIDLSESGYAQSTMNLMYTLISEIFKFAIDNDIIYKNPMPKRTALQSIIESNEKKEKRFYTLKQTKYVLDYCNDHPCQTAFAVHMMLTYGLSKSETLGLTKGAIDLTNHLVHIFQGVTLQNGKSTATKTKNKHRKRNLPLLNGTSVLFSKIDFSPKSEFLFTYDDELIYINTFVRHYNRFMKDMSKYYSENGINVPVLNMHELRHTRATIMVKRAKKRKNFLAVLRTLGWSSEKMVDVYAHTEEGDLKDALVDDYDEEIED